MKRISCNTCVLLAALCSLDLKLKCRRIQSGCAQTSEGARMKTRKEEGGRRKEEGGKYHKGRRKYKQLENKIYKKRA